jgi:hypothetical protein
MVIMSVDGVGWSICLLMSKGFEEGMLWACASSAPLCQGMRPPALPWQVPMSSVM